MTNAVLTKQEVEEQTEKEPVSREIYEQQVIRKQIDMKCRHIKATVGLISTILDNISHNIEQEADKRLEERKKDGTFATEFENEMLNWKHDFDNIRSAFHGVENESEEIEHKLYEIYRFINKKTGTFITWPENS